MYATRHHTETQRHRDVGGRGVWRREKTRQRPVEAPARRCAGSGGLFACVPHWRSHDEHLSLVPVGGERAPLRRVHLRAAAGRGAAAGERARRERGRRGGARPVPHRRPGRRRGL
ncbi:MAG: hypothetical protein AVDCRST_MAG68-58 [uncultured Gemmatimonadetes bacterium]|uniref:Uncharacterized protein n=1 Tax=uncultured Gemmatimonadota bacterium TaxID=203437 RepID=A0A6J4K834_9BACT|nr:MAG: hypothetical protein AVDCRST_MAG68-58 [uncultured Gemmatimonadota bacterium]